MMNRSTTPRSARTVGRIGALALAFGVAAALIGAPAVASADPAKSDRSSSASSSRSADSSSRATTTKRPSAQASAAEAARKRAEVRKLVVKKPSSWTNTDADNYFSRKLDSPFYDDSRWNYADSDDVVVKIKKGR